MPVTTVARHLQEAHLHISAAPCVATSLQTLKHEDSYFVNPGSATGAYSTTTPDAQPSFVLMDVDGSRVSKCMQSSALQPRAPLL